MMFESDKEFFGCQQCIFEGNHPNPEFITLKAREISDRYKSNYEQFQHVLNKMQEIQP
jgi:hypothetical protein